MIEFRTSLDVDNTNNKDDPSFDLLADRVKFLLGQTNKFENTKTTTTKHDLIILSAESKQCFSNENNLNYFNKSQSSITTIHKENVFTEAEQINSDCNVLTSITELIMDNRDYDDLTEYYPIEKQILSPVYYPKKYSPFKDKFKTDNNKSNISDYKLTDIILFHTELLNTQMDHLKRLSEDILRIEKYLLLKSSQTMKNNDPTKLIDFWEKKNRPNNKELEEKHYQNRLNCGICCHSNRNISNINQRRFNQYHEPFELLSKKILNNYYFKNKNKQNQILQTSMKMVQKIDHLLNCYETNVIDKSVQTSQIINDNVNKSNKNEVTDGKLNAISWYLNFDCDYLNENQQYRIEPNGTNLPDLFERKCKAFKERSLIRTIRIKDNAKLRIETANQRKDEIVQVFLLQKMCQKDQKDNKTKRKTNIARPLSPITRRVFTHREMRMQTEKIYQKLPEVKARVNNGKREDEAKRRRMMADIFKQKLKNNAVRGKLNWPITSQAISD